MKLSSILICIFLGTIYSFGQTKVNQTDSIDQVIQEAKLLAHSNPKEGTRKLLDLRNHLEKISYKKGAMYSSMGLVLIYYNDGNYEKSIEETRFVERLAEELKHFEYLSDIHRMRAICYNQMGLNDESYEELKKALPFADKIEQSHVRHYKKALIYESYAGIYGKKEDYSNEILYRQKSIAESKIMTEKNPFTVNAKYQNLAYQYASLGLIYSNLKNRDSANLYFEKAYELTESGKYEIYTNSRATLLSDMAVFYEADKKHQKAISFAKRAEALEKQAPMPYIRRDIFHSLFNAYAETNKIDSSKYYLNLYTSLNDSLIKSEKESIMTPVKQIISDNKNQSKITIRNILGASAFTLMVLILSGGIYVKRKNRNIQKKYEAIISKIKSQPEISDNTEELNESTEKITANEESKVAKGITDDTLKSLLIKLDKFEKSKLYLKKDISRPWLTSHLNTNTKYLFEVIKNHKGKHFPDYINGLRINYIMRKLVEEPKYREYKNEYLAEECGFNSRQVFITAFKKETGFTPSYFIENLKKEPSKLE